MGEKRSGVERVVGEALATRDDATAGGVQPCLPLGGDVDDDDAFGIGAGPLDRELAALRGGGIGARRGPGRPKGSRNRSTEQWVNVILSSKRSPLVVLVDVVNMPTSDLAALLGCDRVDAFRLQMDAAKAVLPYLHQRLPQAVDLSVKGALPMIVLADPAAMGIEQNQYINSVGLGNSDGFTFDGITEVIENAGESGYAATDLKSDAMSQAGVECEAFASDARAPAAGAPTPPPPRNQGAPSPASPSPEQFLTHGKNEQENNPPLHDAGLGRDGE